MPMGCWQFYEFEFPSEPNQVAWNHLSRPSIDLRSSSFDSSRAWVDVSQLQINTHTLSEYQPLKKSRRRRLANPGPFGFRSGVRKDFVKPPPGHNCWAEPIPALQEKKKPCRHFNPWQVEHLRLTSKHIPDRVPLPDKGKPVVRRGRKATGQIRDLTAGLPEEE